jgi:hypothetical protein
MLGPTRDQLAPALIFKRRQNAMQIVGLVIAWVVAIGIIGIGIAYVAKSETNAATFGLPRLNAPGTAAVKDA